MSIKVSVVIPVYNMEPNLDPCIRSLLDQTLTDSEFIFVNDGSSDGSEAIIRGYMEKDSRIRLINRTNGGVSAARNSGLSKARGAYIGFVDADDYVEPDYFARLYESAVTADCDIVVANMKTELEGTFSITSFPFPKHILLQADYIRARVLPLFLKSDELNSACNKLYRREFIHRHEVRFPQGVALGEDGAFNMNAFSAATSMIYIDYSGYNYREVPGSATRQAGRKDYFHRALEVFRGELPPIYEDILDQSSIKRLKAVKLINSVMANVHIYLDPSCPLTWSQRLSYVRGMIHHETVIECLPLCEEDIGEKADRYQRLLLKCVKKRSLWGLYAATSYSRYRNRKVRRRIA
ncbi:glycosyltransferase [Paenibacillus sp. J5C_2022]|uniref:glycosyltransferase family 2 protein n=1 Tax=Paenibacillus sp. J5C2022 TaxID=2977129 RepID=UPI0021D3646D|nr:glycosyltransferase [Paenibacillus sp. J5C2022]MCU6710295.1 glycosyltransferase [Paenibacillus sp. J5C2022]